MNKATTNFMISSSRSVKRIILIICDIIILIISYLFSMYLRLDNFTFLSNFDLWFLLFLLIPIYSIGLMKIDLYQNLSRYTSSKIFKNLSMILFLLSFSSLILIVFFNLTVPRSVPIISFFILLLSIGYLRFVIKYIYQYYYNKPKTKVAIYGANSKGVQLGKALEQSDFYEVKFFLDDKVNIVGNKIDGIKILSIPNNIDLLSKKSIKKIFISPDFYPSKKNLGLIIDKPDLLLIKAPNIDNILSNKNDNSQFKKFTIDDFLERQQILPNKELMRKNIFNQNIFISGAGGSIGSELCIEIINENPKKIILCDSSEFNLFKINKLLNDINLLKKKKVTIKPYLISITNKDPLEKIFHLENIRTVYHTAAYKHVDLLEQNAFEAINNNVFGTKNLIDLSISSNVKNFTLISSDKAVRPTSIMGATKRIAELLCAKQSTNSQKIRFSIVRFGNVLDTSGSVVPIFKEQIEKGGPVTVTNKDATRYFMTKKEAAQLVIQASGLSLGGETFVLDMGQPVKILDLAKKMITLHGFNPILKNEQYVENKNNIEIIFTGLKQGEKMHEELFINNNYFKTIHPRILSITEDGIKLSELDDILKDLKNICLEYKLKKLTNYLRKIPIDFK